MTTPELITLVGLIVGLGATFVAGYLRQPTAADKDAFAMNFKTIATHILPLVVGLIPGVPPLVAQTVIKTMIAVEALPGKTGAEKKAIVMDAAITGLQNLNTAKGKEVVNVDQATIALDKGIDSGVAAVNAVKQHATVAAAPSA